MANIIAFRADGGKNVGMGHIIRCLSLAQAFRRYGHQIYFFSKLDEGIEKVKQENFEAIKLLSGEQQKEGFFYGDPTCLSEEANEIILLLSTYQVDLLFIDSYNVTERYFSNLKLHVEKLAYIDDVNKFPYPVDFVVNGNIIGEFLDYKKCDNKQVFLLGPKYNMIRPEFCNLPLRPINKEVAEIMITTGGSDPYNVTENLLSILLQNKSFDNIRINVLVGSGFTDYKDLINFKQNHGNVSLYSNSGLPQDLPEIEFSSVSTLMLRSDLAISAGGSTLYELAACGTPALVFILADNQKAIVEKMDELGYVMKLGWYNQLNEDLVIGNLLKLMNDFERRKEMSSKGQKLVDGYGTDRIVQSITQNLCF